VSASADQPVLALTLDEAELSAAFCLLGGAEPQPDDVERVARGIVRLQARGLFARGHKDSDAFRLDEWLVTLVGAAFRAHDRLSVSARHRRSGAEALTVQLTYYRADQLTVEHSHAEELHTLMAFGSEDALVERLLHVLHISAYVNETVDTARLGVQEVEQARAAAADNNRSGIVSSLRAAGASVEVADRLAHALVGAQTIGQLVVVQKAPTASLTVLVAAHEVWTFHQARCEDKHLVVARPTQTALRTQLATFWR
jgi:hypothetical protein